MQSPAALVIVLVLVLAVAAGVGSVFYYKSAAMPEPMQVGSPELEQRLSSLEDTLQAIRGDLAARNAAPQRQALEPVSDAQISAAVARWMEANMGGEEAAETTGGADLQQTFLHLTSGLTDDEYLAVWEDLRKKGQMDAMIEVIEGHAASNASDPDAQVMLGVALLQKLQGMAPGMESGDLAMKVDATFDKALELDSQHWDARFVKATALSFWPPMFGKQAEAIEHLETLRGQQESRTTQDAKYAQTYLTLGNLYSQQGQMEKAKSAWQSGATLFPLNAELAQKIKR